MFHNITREVLEQIRESSVKNDGGRTDLSALGFPSSLTSHDDRAALVHALVFQRPIPRSGSHRVTLEARQGKSYICQASTIRRLQLTHIYSYILF